MTLLNVALIEMQKEMADEEVSLEDITEPTKEDLEEIESEDEKAN
jgi:hypothetical protein